MNTDPGVHVTTAQIYSKLLEMELELKGLPAKVEDHEARIRILEGRPVSADHELRIRSLEKSRWLAAGFAAAIGGSAGGVLSQLLTR